jgi:hypothetical protein
VDENLILENALTRIEFAPQHLGVARMLDKTSGVEHVRPGRDGYLLWELVYRHGLREQTLTNLGAPVSRAAIEMLPGGGQRAEMIWDNVRHWHEENTVVVRVTVELPVHDGVAEWRISVKNNSNLWGLWEVRFPYFTEILVPGEYDLAFAANNWGNLLRGFSEERSTTFAYPSCEWALPFIALTRGDSSIYLGAHDPQVWTKTYKVKPGERCYIGTYVENMAERGSGYPGHYPVLAGVYRGDWLAACKRYRAWVVRQAWMAKGPLAQRSDVPRSIKETALWFRENWPQDTKENNPRQLTAALFDAQAYYGVPIGVHCYLWHHNIFDKDYPFFFPARPGFAERVRELVKAGLLVMPYINTVIADYDHPGYRPKLWQAATKDQTGAPYFLPLGIHESGRMTDMCPATETWQDTIAGLVDRLTGECGVNAVYLDLLAASPPDLCFDRGHGHPLGGGGWWWQGTQALLKKVRAIAEPRGVALTTESIADPYMNGAEGYLTWAPPIGMEIPMMPAVYSGYAVYIGSPTAPHITEQAFVAAQARAFTWGCQNGWMAPNLHRDPAHQGKMAYLKRIAQYHVAANKFFTYGELLNLLPPSAPVGTVTVKWPDYKAMDQPVELPSVLGALWRAQDGHLGVVLCNITDEPAAYPYAVDAPAHGLPASGAYRLEHSAPAGRSYIGEQPAGVVRRTENLAPREIRVLEIAAI